MALQLLLASQGGIHLVPDVRIRPQQSLVVSAGRYSRILFRAEHSDSDAQVPASYAFKTSGSLPPGMVFENYPCQKPGEKNCPALASADGIYLDGVPTAPGSYKLTIKAIAPSGETAEREFTVTVKIARPDR